jgi:hypothetical protein
MIPEKLKNKIVLQLGSNVNRVINTYFLIKNGEMGQKDIYYDMLI